MAKQVKQAPKHIMLESIKEVMTRLGVTLEEAGAATNVLAKTLYPHSPACSNCKSRNWTTPHWDGIKLKYVCGEDQKKKAKTGLINWLQS